MKPFVIAAALSIAICSNVHAQKAVRIIVGGQGSDEFVPATTAPAEEGDNAAANAPAATQASASSTKPATKPAKRIDAFLKLKFNRTPQSVLAAISAKEDPKADQAAKFASHVVAGRWDQVAKVIATFDKDDSKKLFAYVLKELASGGGGGQQNLPPEVQQQMQQQMALRGGGGPMMPGGGSYLLPLDVIGLLSAAPSDLTDEQMEPVGQLLSRALAKTNVIEPILAAFEKGIAEIGGAEDVGRLRAASLLVAANHPYETGKFLPKLKDDLADNDPKLLDLHAKYLMALAARDRHDDDTETRNKAWLMTQALIVHPKTPQKIRDESIARAIELWPQINKDNSATWFKEALAQKDEGLSVLANIGTTLSQNFMNRDMNKRRDVLQQQKKLVDRMLADSGDPQRWAAALNVLAIAWQQEAEYTRSRPTQREMSGNYGRRVIYGPYGEEVIASGPQNDNQPPPVDPQVMLDTAPSKDWIALLEPSLAVRVRALIAEMHFKNDQPADALPIIESLAPNNKDLARQLANDLISNFGRVWDPNQNQRRYGGYYGPYGYQQSESGIPLTRAAQVRNLAELSLTLQCIKKLAIEPLNDSVIVQTFANAHSPAEVFRLDEITQIFGDPEKMNRDTLVELLQTMRQRLASSWRSPAVQQQQKTKRTDKETDAEVTRGYELLTSILEARINVGATPVSPSFVDPGRATQPSPLRKLLTPAAIADWKLLTLEASALYDWAEFDYGNQVELAVYTARRDKAFALFKQAAQKYASLVATLKESDQTPLVHEQWFNAALGASDLAALTRQSQPSPAQIDQIRAALKSVGGDDKDLTEKHIEAFGKWLAESVNTLKPELKHRYLKAGIEIVGDHPSAAAARKLVQYYADLLTEVELHAAVDGDTIIGHTAPFGLHLTIRHTQAVGRESGGFNKYLTNQQNRGYYYYGGSGQGPTNYRDDFEKKIREALVDRFTIQSITWYDEKVEPRAIGKLGWRETPLAYVLLKPKDASVDKIPPIQMDLDFQDKNGTVILPVTTSVILVDSKPDAAPARPIDKIELTQILDQRDAANGKLSLDIKATAHGLIPDLPALLDTSSTGFNVDKIADQGLAVDSMDAEGSQLAPVTERSWLVNLSAPKGTTGPAVFRFPTTRQSTINNPQSPIKFAYKRYADADVADVDPQLAITGLPLRSSHRWLTLIVAACVAIAILIAGMLRRRRRKPQQEVVPTYTIPKHVSPFTVIDLLKRMRSDEELGLSPQEREKLTGEILSLQERFFAPRSNGDATTTAQSNGEPNLIAIADQWVHAAQRR